MEIMNLSFEMGTSSVHQCQVSQPHYLFTVAAEHIQLFFYKQIFIKIMRFEDLALAVSTSAKSLNLIIFLQLLLNTSSYFFYKQIFIKIMRFEDLALAVSTSAKSLNLIIFVQLLLNTSSHFFTNRFSLR